MAHPVRAVTAGALRGCQTSRDQRTHDPITNQHCRPPSRVSDGLEAARASRCRAICPSTLPASGCNNESRRAAGDDKLLAKPNRAVVVVRRRRRQIVVTDHLGPRRRERRRPSSYDQRSNDCRELLFDCRPRVRLWWLGAQQRNWQERLQQQLLLLELQLLLVSERGRREGLLRQRQTWQMHFDPVQGQRLLRGQGRLLLGLFAVLQRDVRHRRDLRLIHLAGRIT